MFRLVAATLWRRRIQTALLVVLATVAAAGAATAPGYVAASLQALAAASVSDAAPADRLVSAHADRDVSGHLPADLSTFVDRARAGLDLAGFTGVAGAAMVAVVTAPGQAAELRTLTYRDDVCRHLSIEGACPDGSGQVLLPAAVAAGLGVGAGDALPLRAAPRFRRCRRR